MVEHRRTRARAVLVLALALVVPVGSILVAEQLPASKRSRGVALDFAKRYEAQFGAGSRNLFAGYAYDAYLLLDKAVATALRSAARGTQAFRDALADALVSVTDLAATHGVININAKDHSAHGVSGRLLVVVRGGQWILN